MKVTSFPKPLCVVATIAQGRAILFGTWFLVRTHKLLAGFVVLLAAILFFLVRPHDWDLLHGLHFWQGEQAVMAQKIAYFLGTWGDYPTYNLPLALVLWLYGVWSKKRAWRRIAVICLLGATLAGLGADCVRLTAGRARPDSTFPDAFYGISHAYKGGFESFPSGHAAACFGTAMALLVTEFPLGLLTTAYALAVVWARLELQRHYPSDVLVGSIIGIYFGLMVGFGAKLRRPPPPLDRAADSI